MLTAAGISCLRIVPLAGHSGFTRLAIAGIDDRNSKARRLWVNSSKHAEKIMREVFSDRRFQRSDEGGFIAEADAVEVEGLVLASARLINITVENDAWVDRATSTIAIRIDDAIRHMQKTGRLKSINTAYAALPITDRPPFNAFKAERLRSAIAINPADVSLLLNSLRRAA